MKRRICITTVAVAITLIASSCFGSCFGCGGYDGGESSEPITYTVQYTDDGGVHTVTVTKGEPYSISAIPEKFGYEFLGLFDAETGGTKFVNAQGSSVSPFNDNASIVLYPQYKAKEYTLVLDYQGAEISGARQFTVNYGENLPELPKNLKLDYHDFSGWYTAKDCGGTQVADKYGLVPVVSEVNEKNFDLSVDSTIIYLYAGFNAKTYTVTFNYGAGEESEEVKVEHGTPIKSVITTKRDKNGWGVLTWSKLPNDTTGSGIFDGKVTDDLVLYAVEYAPVIELDTNGGKEIAAVVARAGEEVILPVPVRGNYKFVYWADEKGNKTDIVKMPEGGARLKAVWRAKIVFDENGGSEVEDICVATGENITLPVPEKEGYIFAGWYTVDKEKYDATKMPSAGIALKAGWYRAKVISKTLVSNSTESKKVVYDNSLSAKNRLKIDLSKEMPSVPSKGVAINYEINFKWGNTDKYVKANGKVALYEGDELNSDYELAKKSLSHNNQWDRYLDDSLNGSTIIHKNVLYFYYCGTGNLQITLSGGYGANVGFYDIRVKITYPDTATLFL